MDFENSLPDKAVSLFVKNILVLEEHHHLTKTIPHFFVDSYPGLIFQETWNGLLVNRHKKQMPVLFGKPFAPLY